MESKLFSLKLITFSVLIAFGSSFSAFAEGTAQTTESSSDYTHLLTNFGEYNDFGRYNGSVDQRLFIHIEDPENEVVYFGFSTFYDQPHWPNEGSARTGYYRIKDPSGNVVWPTAGSNAGQLNSSLIANRTQAVNGPNQIVGTGGYNAHMFNPDGLPAGDYYIEFSNSQSAYDSDDLIIPWYDITVATEGGSPSAIDGRVFSYNWAFMCPSIDFPNDYFDRDFTGNMYIYSDDGFVSSIDFSDAEFQGAAFNIAFNSFGVSNTGDFETDRASVEGINSTSIEYRVFLNNPDETAFPNGTFGEFVVDAEFPRLYGCPDDNEWFFRFAATEAGRVEVLIDSDGNNEYDPGTADVLLESEIIPWPGEVAPYERDIPWNGLDGLGVPIPTGSDITVEYSYSQGFYHLPVYDVEHLRTGMEVTSVRPTTPQPYNPTFFYDDEAISETLPGGQPALELNGCTPPCHYWDAVDYGNVNTINTFWYAYRSETIFTIPFETPPPTCAGCPFVPMAINGTVFHDIDEGGTQNGSESGVSGIDVRIYGDVNGNNTYEPGIDTLVDQTTTNGTGFYELIGSFATTHLIVIDQLDLPDNSVMTTTDLHIATFFSLFDASCDNDFGFIAYPIAVIDYDTIQDTSIPLVVDVQGNDTIPFPPVTTTIVTPPVNGGTAVPNPDGTVTYTSIPNYIGIDSLEYSICDGDGLCDTAWVVIQIGDICGDGIDNDGDGFIDNYSPEIVIDAHGENPTCIGFSDGTLTVTATGGRTPYYYSWTESGNEIATTADVSGVPAGFYTITVTDENGCDESFGVLLQEFNCPPVANNDFNNTLVDLPVSGNVLTNDWDPQGDILTVTGSLLDQPDNGTVTINGNGDYTYTPDPGFSGEDTFIYIMCDGGAPNGCDTATVFIEVIPITAGNEPPIANADVAQTMQGIPVSSNVLTNDDDPDGDNIVLNLTPITGPNNGTVTLNPDGSFTYTPDPTFIGVDTYIYSICDDGIPSLCDTAVVTINVLEDPTPNNQPPFAGDDGAVTNVDTPVSGDLLANDSDPDGDNITVNTTPILGPSSGTVTINPDGTFDYTPNGGFNGTDVFTYSICDDGVPSMCDTATVTIQVVPDNGGNEPPIANDDEAQTNENTPVSGNVLNNDGDPDGDPITSAGPLTGPDNGTVSIAPNGDFTYTPDPGFTGTDTFTYQTCDAGPLCDTATVTITVLPPYDPGNDPPFAGDDAALTPQEVPVSGDLLLNDNDPNEDNITINTTPVSGTSNGGLTILTDGTYTYTPNPGFTGTDQFVYQICDDGTPSLCAQATCYITVYPDNNPPIAEDDFNNTLVNIPINGNVITNDSDPDGDNITVSPTLVDQPDNGIVTINPDGTYTYTPNTDYEGEDSFSYEICDDGVPSLCDTAEVAIEIIPITLGNEPPIANDDVAQTLQGVPVTSNVLGNDDDPDGDPITLTTTPVTDPSNGSVSILPDGTYTYTPDPAFIGIDSYTYRICDDGNPSLCDTATVTIDVLPDMGPENDPPFAGDDGALTPQDVPVSGQLLTNDSDPNGDNIFLQLPQISGPSNGSVILDPNGTYTYTPNPGYTGPDQFVYEICDDGVPSLCAQATCYITVYADNVPPVAINDFNNTLVDIPVSGNVITNDFDPDGDNISVNPTPLVDPTNGTVTLASTGVYTYTPDPGFTGTDSFVYILCDDGNPSLCDTALVAIKVIETTLDNDPPVANPDAYVTIENIPLTDNILINDADPDGDNIILNTTPLSGPNNGSVTILAGGTLTYTPDLDFIGQDTLSYYICDDGVPSLCDTTTVIITVLPDRNGPENDPPFAGDDAALTPVNVPVSGEILSNDFDPNGDNIVVQLPQVSGPANGSVVLNLDGTYTYTPNTDYIGPDQFVYQICDDGVPSLCATATVYITVYPGPYIEWEVTEPLCNGDANGAIDITVFNATLPVTYSWSNGATTEDLNGIPAATYVVTVTDALGSVVQESITVSQADVLGVSTTVSDETTVNGCDGSATANPTGGTPPFTYLWDDPLAQTTQTAVDLCAGIYQVFITDSNGCMVNTSIVINPPSCDLDVLVTGTNVSCNGGSDGTVTAIPITAQNNTPFTYDWNNGGTTQTITGVTAGPYSVEITDAIGCQASGSITITEPSALSISTTVVDEQNFGACDGSATAMVSGGTPPYAYLWDDPLGQTTAEATNLCPGTYTVLVTDANGCTSQTTITVNELSCAGYVVSINPYGLSCFEAGDGAAAAVVSGGTAPFTYLWSTTETTDSISGLVAGTYTVTVTDDVACEQTVSVDVTQPALLEAATAVDHVTCYGFSNGTIELTVTGGTTPYDFDWSNGATTEDLAGLGPDTYTVLVTDANGCTVNASGTVTEPDSLDASTVDVNITCNGGSDGSIDLTVEGGLGPYLVSWDSGQNTEDISGLTAGTYTATIVDQNGCILSYTTTLTEADEFEPTITPGGPTTFCEGDSVLLTATAGASYLWSTGDTTQTITVTSTGSYAVNVITAEGCDGDAPAVQVTVNPLPEPTVSVIGPSEFCEGDSTTLTTGSFDSYLWSTGDTTQSIIVSTAGNYTVTVTDGNGCVGTSAAQAITVNPLPTPTITADGPTTFCDGDQVVLTASSASGYLWSTGEVTQSITVTASGSYTVTVTDANGCMGDSDPTVILVHSNPIPTITPDGPTEFCDTDSVILTASDASSYIWSTGDTTSAITVFVSGTYNVTVTDANGCVGTSADITITVFDLPTPTVTPSGPTTFCDGDSVMLTASGATAYLWSTGDTTQTITVMASGTYVVTVTDVNGCSADAAGVDVVVNPLPTPTITPSGPIQFCDGGDVDLTVSASDSYLWNTGATIQTINVSTTGSYWATVTDANGCSANSDTIDVVVDDNPIPTITADGPTEFCTLDSVTLTASAGSSFLWSTGDTTQSILVTASGIYDVTVTDAQGCTGTSAPTQVTVHELPDATVSWNSPLSFCPGDSVRLVTRPAVTYLWSPNGDTTIDTWVYTSGQYTVLVTDENGCQTQSDTVTVTVFPQPEPFITPNGPLAFCDGEDVILTLGNNTPFSPSGPFLWNTSEITQAITVSNTGSYWASLTDLNGCIANSDTVNVDVWSLPEPVISTVGPPSFCVGDTIFLISSEADSYLWSSGDTTQTITVLVSGEYTVTVTDTNGCSATSPPTFVDIQANPNPTVTPDGQISMCDGDSIVLTAATAVSYLWNTGDTTQTLTVWDSGIYNVTAWDSTGCFGTSADVFVTKNPLPEPTITLDGPNEFCEGGSVTLSTQTFSSYIWNTGASSQSITVSSTGIFNVTVTDANGCVGTSPDQDVDVHELPEVEITPLGPLQFCEGGSVLLEAPAGNNFTYLWSTGATTQTIEVFTSGAYDVIVTDEFGCVGTSPLVSVEVYPAPVPVISALGPTEFCVGDSVILTTNSASEYLWSTGDTTQSITVYTTGNYTVTHTSEFGCVATSGSFSIIVNENPTPSITADGPTEFCDGGSVNLTAAGGDNYLWSTGATTETITVVSSGNYSVTVFNANGCSTESSALTVTEWDDPVPIISPDGPTEFCDGDSVTLTSSEQVSYVWSTGETTQSIMVTTSGTYSVSVVDTNGCTGASAPIVISVFDNPDPTVALNGEPDLCQGESVTLSSSTAESYLWSTGDTTQSIVVDTAGSYTVTVTDANGCEGTSDPVVINLNDNPEPTITPDGSTTLCEGQGLLLESSPAVSYLWNTGATTNQVTVGLTGTYWVEVTDTNGCTGRDSVDVTVNPTPFPIPEITADGPTTFCEGDSVALSTDPWDSYTWNTGDTTQTIVVDESGLYTVTVTNEYGCEADAAGVVVTVNPSPEPPLLVSGDGELCEGESVILSTTLYNEYAWTTGDTTQTIVVDEAGTYSVTVTNAFGCEGTSESFDVIVNELPEVDVQANGPTSLCAGETVDLEAIGEGPFVWNTFQTDSIITVFLPGDYWVASADTNGCIGISDTVTVEFFAPFIPEITADGPTAFCDGDEVTLTVTEGMGYLWSTGETTQSITVNTSGVYSVEVLDTNGCSGIAAQTITVLPSPIALIIPDSDIPFCEGDTVVLTASFSLGGSYEWSTGETTQSITITESGIYSVTITNLFGCSDEFILPVLFVPVITPTITLDGDSTICEGESVVLSASFTLGSYVWSTGETTQSIMVTEAGSYSVTTTNLAGCPATSDVTIIELLEAPRVTAQEDIEICFGTSIELTATGFGDLLWNTGQTGSPITVSPLETTTYSVTASSIECQLTSSDDVTVVVLGSPSANFENGDAYQGEPVYFSDLSEPGNIISWEWEFGNGETASVQNPTYTYDDAGDYIVTLIVTDDNGCMDTVTAELDIDRFFLITNVLTPNGDGFNDYAWIRNSNADVMEVLIYNRWGHLVWDGYGKDQRWDGRTSSGVKLESGTYYYVIKMDEGEGEVEELTGYITLIR